jgi:hypothetical protein
MRVSTFVLLVTAALSLSGCQRPAPGRARGPATGSATEASTREASAPVPATAPPPSTYPSTPSLAPLSDDAPTDEFVGWYFEKGGAGMLLGCGRAMPLEVADATFLHQLNGRRGGSTAPVYVRLAVRAGAGSKLEVARIEQFGVDEGPAPDCALSLTP